MIWGTSVASLYRALKQVFKKLFGRWLLRLIN